MENTSILPGWRAVLAVVAHPDDESFGLGAVLSTFAGAGSLVDVLCLTRGEASTLHGVEGDLSLIRESELRAAADALGVRRVTLLGHPDGGVAALQPTVLDGDVERALEQTRPDGLVVFDSTGISGHPDHVAATAAAVRAGDRHALPVLAWALPDEICASLASEGYAGFLGRRSGEIDLALTVDRTAQQAAVDCHPSQAVPGSVLWRRLELQGNTEHLRWLRRP
ncbi:MULTISPECIES: PIG-L family deacetylase [unclassified Dietzia]|uniref:PIG-L family deacetylase n=1 Tax=unclassified Dietzia TaxID=2617939 RepID=UPI000D21EA2F|nr:MULTISPECIES: PIG-L deacetylase family protein [unclassified Dietzia]AVZ40613.1 GlcNAc-PI de-N-acetylase [Dietzia sp. JS16-p6b]QGW26174.1 LmbE family protein [Dietzia sp. DQ12-45-1b]